jgi:hypothetical protein
MTLAQWLVLIFTSLALWVLGYWLQHYILAVTLSDGVWK